MLQLPTARSQGAIYARSHIISYSGASLTPEGAGVITRADHAATRVKRGYILRQAIGQLGCFCVVKKVRDALACNKGQHMY